MNNLGANNSEIREKIRAGLDLAFKRLVDYKKRNDGVFVISKNGKVVHVAAKDM